MKILFVCNANVGRSQAAEAIFNSLTKDTHTATSAGTQVGVDEGQKLKDKPGAAGMLTALKEIGIDASENERNQVTKEMVLAAGKVIVMADRETLPEYLLNEPKTTYWKVELTDFTPEACAVARDQITSLVEDLIKRLN